MTRVFVPLDSVSVACGADEIADSLARIAARRGLDVTIVRNGSRGMAFLEPLVEVETPQGRIGYGPVEPGEVEALLDAGLLEGGAHEKRVGDPQAHPFMAGQTRLIYKRCGITDPLSIEDYEAHGGLAGLRRAIALEPAAIVEEVKASGLRGRGGAAFPTGIKWNTVLETEADRKYVVANADEGDSGTFADRMVMEGDPFLLIEGMAIAGLATKAEKGFVYLRSEYPVAIRVLREAVDRARAAGILGASVLGSGRAFDIEVRVGAGAYVCGEETSLLDSLEGKRGQVRFKPPLPAIEGLFGKPTVINNVITLASTPQILAEGGQAYHDHGIGKSRGTIPLQIAGNVKYGGLYETGFGMTLGDIVEAIGGGTRSGRPIRAVQVGGPLGAYMPVSLFHVPFDYEAFAEHGGLVGHAGLVVFDDTVDMTAMARFAFEFCAEESCGKCTPCRVGAVRGHETMQKVIDGVHPAENLALVEDLCETMRYGSLCALGGLTYYPVLSAIKHFPEDFHGAAQPVREAAE